MGKLLIAVKSCQEHLERGFHHEIRKTWAKDARLAGVDVKFFVGKTLHPTRLITYEPDEVTVGCDDTYRGLPYKTREICRWVTGKMVDHVFLCDNDTYLHIPYLMGSFYEKFDYQGWMLHKLGVPFKYDVITQYGEPEKHDPCYTWASGGLGYFLSKRAAIAVAYDQPNSWAEDLWVGQVIGNEIAQKQMTGMSTRENNYAGNNYSWHFRPEEYGGLPYHPSLGWMMKMHKEQHQ